jgi:hypothetical protein
MVGVMHIAIPDLPAKRRHPSEASSGHDGDQLQSRLPDRAGVTLSGLRCGRAQDRVPRPAPNGDLAALLRHRCAGLRPQPSPVGHHLATELRRWFLA